MEDYRWVAGILEGEGCFSIFKRKNGIHSQCSIQCEMSDRDTIEQLQKELTVGNIAYRSNENRGNRKPTWILTIQKQQDVFDTLIRVMPYLKSRRLGKASELFNYLEPIVCK